jgi:hypothetical protein
VKVIRSSDSSCDATLTVGAVYGNGPTGHCTVTVEAAGDRLTIRVRAADLRAATEALPEEVPA